MNTPHPNLPWLVDDVLKRSIRSYEDDNLGPEYQRLAHALTRASEGGKRFRPELMTTMYRSMGGQDLSVAAHAAAAIELLHTAFVIHDDVIDGDDIRRGQPNISGEFYRSVCSKGADDPEARAYANSAGLLAGDLALAASVRAMATCGATSDVTARLLDLLEATLRISAAGELADVYFSLDLGPVSLSDVLTMEERKTAVYSFVLPLQAGAILAGATETFLSGLRELGCRVGIAFQLLDDLQDVFCDEVVAGKSILTDIREQKHTPLLAHARTTAAWPLIAQYMRDPCLDQVGCKQMRELLTSCGSRRFVEDLAGNYVSTAVKLADELGVSRAVTRRMTDLVDILLKRLS